MGCDTERPADERQISAPAKVCNGSLLGVAAPDLHSQVVKSRWERAAVTVASGGMRFDYQSWATRKLANPPRRYSPVEHTIYVGTSLAAILACVGVLYWAVDFLAHLILG
jgi:hypothetical protein